MSLRELAGPSSRSSSSSTSSTGQVPMLGPTRSTRTGTGGGPRTRSKRKRLFDRVFSIALWFDLKVLWSTSLFSNLIARDRIQTTRRSEQRRHFCSVDPTLFFSRHRFDPRRSECISGFLRYTGSHRLYVERNSPASRHELAAEPRSMQSRRRRHQECARRLFWSCCPMNSTSRQVTMVGVNVATEGLGLNSSPVRRTDPPKTDLLRLPA